MAEISIVVALLLPLHIVACVGGASPGDLDQGNTNITFSGFALEANSPLFQVRDHAGEQILQLTDNVYVPESDDISGKVALTSQLGRSALAHRL